MERYTEIRWHGRAQQGVVTAAKLLGEAALREGKYVQAFPDFGPERMGAPVRAFNRLSTEPIRLHCGVKNPDVVIIVDPTLIAGGGVSQSPLLDGMKEDTVFIVNTPKGAAGMRGALGLKNGEGKVYTVDASRISLEKIGRHLPNTAMLGALAKVTNVVEMSALIENFKENYSKKFSPKVVEGNIGAMEKGSQDVKGE
ncbi:MAG: 2-oxoacid:acceptor oxidoreductase family protein [Deltaproteobacteria bacterium]|nr:2-oxoacid:acceptor oxidoreductase family protein [Deltaproteobacteria bacterium]